MGLRTIFTEASITAGPFFEGRGFRVIRRNDFVVRGVETTNFSMGKDLR